MQIIRKNQTGYLWTQILDISIIIISYVKTNDAITTLYKYAHFSILIRHTRAYNPQIGPHPTAPRTPTMSFQASSKKIPLRPADKYKTAMELMRTACSSMSTMSSQDLDFQMQRCRAFVSSIMEGIISWKIHFMFFFLNFYMFINRTTHGVCVADIGGCLCVYFHQRYDVCL